MTACQHCDEQIELLNGYWTDQAGFMACVKAPLSSLPVEPGKPPGFVLHTPMPVVTP
jgi:hypothetical protein